MFPTRVCSARAASPIISKCLRSQNRKYSRPRNAAVEQKPEKNRYPQSKMEYAQQPQPGANPTTSYQLPLPQQISQPWNSIYPTATTPVGRALQRPPPASQSIPSRSRGNPRMSNGKEPVIAPSQQSGGIPNPTKEYLRLSNVPAMPTDQPRHLLVVIDLNGTLLHRPNRKQPTKFVMRPNAAQFLKYCADTFTVVLWSSARPENVANMCKTILVDNMRDKIVAIWGRDKFGLSPQDYNLHTQVYKRLSTLWKDPIIARSHPLFESGHRWDQTNTVLIDDSIEKGRSEPYNLIQIPEWTGDMNETGSILPQVHDYLNFLSTHMNVSATIRVQPFIIHPYNPIPQ